MSKLDKIIKIINKVVDLLDDDPKPQTKKHDIKTMDELVLYDYNTIVLKIQGLIAGYHDLCINRYNQVDQSKDYYLKWEGALYIINKFKDEFNKWYAAYIGKEDETDESD